MHVQIPKIQSYTTNVSIQFQKSNGILMLFKALAAEQITAQWILNK